MVIPLVEWYVAVECNSADVERDIGHLRSLLSQHAGNLLATGATIDDLMLIPAIAHLCLSHVWDAA